MAGTVADAVGALLLSFTTLSVVRPEKTNMEASFTCRVGEPSTPRENIGRLNIGSLGEPSAESSRQCGKLGVSWASRDHMEGSQEERLVKSAEGRGSILGWATG